MSEPVHRCPPKGEGILPCCGRTPFEVPGTDRMTVDEALVTCAGPGMRPLEVMTPRDDLQRPFEVEQDMP